MAPLAADPAALDGAGAAVVSTGEGLGSVVSTLTSALGGCNGMAGDDPAGAAFGRSYNSSASKLLEAMATTRNGLCRLGDGVRMSAHNYSVAEAVSNISGRGEPLSVPHATDLISAGSTPSAVGSGASAPAGWGWVANYIGMIWPNGNSAKLQAAAAAWISAGANFEVSEILGEAGPMGSIGAQQIPEGPAITAAFTDANRSAAAILQQCVSIATQLSAYAAKIDTAHAAILDLLSRICDPTTGLKEVWEFLTDQDEDEIRKVANDIRTIVNQFTAEVDVLRQQIATTLTESTTILTAMGRYADREWDQFLHHTDVGRALNQVGQFGKGIGEEVGGLLKDDWTYGPIRAFVDPKGWYHSWEQMIGGMAPLVGLGGDHAPGVAQAWKDLGKNAVHWDEWKTNPAEAAGKSTFDLATLLVPGGGEAAAATKGARAAADAAEAAAKAAPREAAASRALGDAAKAGAPAPAPHAPPVEAPPHERPPTPPDKPAAPAPTKRASAPADGQLPHGPTESKQPVADTPGTADAPRPVDAPGDRASSTHPQPLEPATTRPSGATEGLAGPAAPQSTPADPAPHTSMPGSSPPSPHPFESPPPPDGPAPAVHDSGGGEDRGGTGGRGGGNDSGPASPPHDSPGPSSHPSHGGTPHQPGAGSAEHHDPPQDDHQHAAFSPLTSDDQSALADYTGAGYRDLNSALRSGVLDASLQARIDALNRALEKLPAYEGPVVRGTNLPSEVLERYQAGEVITESAFTSTTSNPAVAQSSAFGGNVEFRILSTTGRDVSSISMFPHEQEILFPTNAKFYVISRTVDPTTGRTIIEMIER